MASVVIKPHVGEQRADDGSIVETDTGIDAIFLTGPEWPTPKRVGYVGRDPNSPVNLVCQVAETDRAAIIAAVKVRDDGQTNEVRVNEVPQLSEAQQPTRKR